MQDNKNESHEHHGMQAGKEQIVQPAAPRPRYAGSLSTRGRTERGTASTGEIGQCGGLRAPAGRQAPRRRRRSTRPCPPLQPARSAPQQACARAAAAAGHLSSQQLHHRSPHWSTTCAAAPPAAPRGRCTARHGASAAPRPRPPRAPPRRRARYQGEN